MFSCPLPLLLHVLPAADQTALPAAPCLPACLCLQVYAQQIDSLQARESSALSSVRVRSTALPACLLA